MPIYPPGEWLNPESRPRGCETVGAGRFAFAPGSRFDRHFHDDDEIWLISGGVGTMVLEGSETVIRAGDIVLIPATTLHDLLEVEESLTGFFVETGHPAGGRAGHLHIDETDALGHEVTRGNAGDASSAGL